jgi:hypothetical protein
MTGADETANLVGQLTQGYREHRAAEGEEAEPEITAVPGQVLGSDIEGHADALADDADRVAALLTAFAKEPGPRSIDAIAVFRGLSRAAESMAAAAAEMRRQEWFDLEDEAEPEAVAAWEGAMEGLKSAASTFEWIATGWI